MIAPLLLAWAALAASDAQPLARQIYVLSGPEVEFTRDALQSLQIVFRPIDRLDELPAARQAILVLSGKAPGDSAQAARVATLLRDGAHVLAIGGRATWMIDNKLFDAKAYCPTGTTIHESSFRGYHRLTFGYPGRKPQDDWLTGVPMLVRATGGPLMELGPQATSILSAGGPFSLVAFQRVGRGLAVLIGADPQGGNVFRSLQKPTPTPGAKLGTDRLLANALAFLADPCCNLIPNSGFEEDTDLPPAQSNWLVTLKGKATHEFSHSAAPEGRTFVRLTAPGKSSAALQPTRPILVEGGARYELSFFYRATGAWTVNLSFLKGASEGLVPQSRQTLRLPAAASWQRHQAQIALPGEACAVEIAPTLVGPGELCLDDFSLRLTVPPRRDAAD